MRVYVCVGVWVCVMGTSGLAIENYLGSRRLDCVSMRFYGTKRWNSCTHP